MFEAIKLYGYWRSGAAYRVRIALGLKKRAWVDAHVHLVKGEQKSDAYRRKAPIGLVPAEGEIDTDGLDLSDEQMRELLSVDAELFKQQLPQVREHLERFGDRLPGPILAQLRSLEERLG